MLTLLPRAGLAGPLEDASVAYEHGDYATEYRLLRPLADQGNAAAEYGLGFMYAHGYGVPQDYTEAAKWYRLAADQGDMRAQNSLGQMFRLGKGVPQNDGEAFKWFRFAAELGEPLAQYNIGVMYHDGQGVSQNFAEAWKWWDKAAKQGNVNALNKFSSYSCKKMFPKRVGAVPGVNCYNYAAQSAQRTSASNHDPPYRIKVSLKKEGGVFVVPVQINGAITLNFVIDSGAADVTLPADVFSTLRRTETVRDTDIIGEQSYILADGSRSQSFTFTIRSLKVGQELVENVRGSVASAQGTLLLGQSFFERFRSWSIDNAKHELLLDPE
jgi:clan AA aspartic protease (TIGR02281 family)